MGNTDLDAVANRRAVLTRELIGLQTLRSKLEAEQQELAMAERVLRRLAHLPYAPTPLAAAPAPLASPIEQNDERIRRLSVERAMRPDEQLSPRPEYFTRFESGGVGEVYSSISELSAKLAQAVLRQPARLGLLLKRKP